MNRFTVSFQGNDPIEYLDGIPLTRQEAKDCWRMFGAPEHEEEFDTPYSEWEQ